jgi:Mrp family chromosome partitioning ATPase
MSKNFELLQQIGNDEELFQTADSKHAAVTLNLEPAQELDQETFESLMEKAAAMGIFQAPNEPPPQVPARPADSGPEREAENGAAAEPAQPRPKTFRTARNPTSRIGEAESTIETRVRQRHTQTLSSPKSAPVEEKPKTILETPIKEALPVARRTAHQISRGHGTPSPTWLESIKGAVKSLEWKAEANRFHGGIDMEAVAREEEIRLVQRVFPSAALDAPRIAMFSGLESKTGCGGTCARVAELLAARAEGPVCIVDANFQAPSLHEYFGMENLKGLAEATVESGPIQAFAQQIPEPDLWLIPSGKAAAKLRFPAMADGLRVRIEELRDTFKYVVIHSGPLRLETSAMLLSRWTDGVVLVLEANATRRDTARRAKEMLDAANVNLLGIVLSNRTFPIPDAIYRRLFF